MQLVVSNVFSNADLRKDFITLKQDLSSILFGDTIVPKIE